MTQSKHTPSNTAVTTQTVSVNLTENPYDIHIGHSVLKDAGTYIRPLTVLDYVIIVADVSVQDTHMKTVVNSLESVGLHARIHMVDSGEKSKNLDTFARLCNAILSQGIERQSVVIAIGGGVIGDLAGFVSASLLRGIRFVQIPTTLLSQVDSSVGGKTGINSPAGKNLIGAFYQPALVLTDIECLSTLPQRHIISGYAEVMKYGCIWDNDFFQWLEKSVQSIKNKDNTALIHAIKRSCEIKATVVAQDEKENGVRALLNLGHTFGHALESLTGYSDIVLHGEGVSIGIVLAYKTAYEHKWVTMEQCNQVINHCKDMGLPTSLKDIKFTFQPKDIYACMYKDKKVSQGTLRFVMPQSIGTAFVTADIDKDIVLNILHQECNVATQSAREYI